MARILITGSADGLGRAAARTLIDEGHEVVLHARSRARASTFDDIASRSTGVIIGDLDRAVDTQSVAVQVNAIGPMDAVIHNAENRSSSRVKAQGRSHRAARRRLSTHD
jgi:NAD(P)-dependent dehydrogenase (short-subunit alcohol dehydrogenase family)